MMDFTFALPFWLIRDSKSKGKNFETKMLSDLDSVLRVRLHDTGLQTAIENH